MAGCRFAVNRLPVRNRAGFTCRDPAWRIQPKDESTSMKRRIRSGAVIAFASLALALSSAQAFGQEHEAFTKQRFTELQEQGALILLDVYADWCPTCAQQQKILADFQKQNPDVPLHILQIDFDRQKEFVRHFRAPRQSTFIVYRGTERVWFSVAETSRDVIFDALKAAAAEE